MNESISEKINPNWYSITIIAILVLGLLMLFFNELPSLWKNYFIPSLVVFIIGTSLIGFIHGSNFRAKGMKNNFKEPLIAYWSLYLIWFLIFLAYLIFRGVL